MIKEMIIFAILLLLFSLIISMAIVLIIFWFKSFDEEGDSDVLHKNKKSNKRK